MFNKIILIYIIVIIHNTVYYGLLKVFIMQSAFKLIFIILFFRILITSSIKMQFLRFDFMDNVNLDLEIFHIPTYFLFNKTYYITLTICEMLFVSYVNRKSSADKMSQQFWKGCTHTINLRGQNSMTAKQNCPPKGKSAPHKLYFFIYEYLSKVLQQTYLNSILGFKL